MRLRALLPALLFTLAPASALANGRFPLANQLVFSAVNSEDLVVRTSFGVLTSHDHGKTMNWVCEAVAGYSGTQDPGVGFFADGTIALAAFEGLSITHDGGCDWAFAGGGLTGEYVIDVALNHDDTSRGVAITSTGISDNTFHVQIYETTDNAVTWTASGPPLPTDFLAVTVDVAPTDPQRLYASGTVNAGADGAIETSRDRGLTWTRTMVDLAGDQSIYIAAVDPTDPDRFYIRSHGSDNDRLILSTDAGATFSVIATVNGPMEGFAISPDGSRLAMGGEMSGFFTAGRDDLNFVKRDDVAVACLTWAADGLYACDNGFKHGFTIGVTTDEAMTWTPVLPNLAAINAPLDTCAPNGAFASSCNDTWPMLAAEFGKPGFTMGSAGSGGAAPTPATASPAPSSSKSGCDVAVGAEGGGMFAFAVATFAWTARQRRRKTQPSVLPSETRGASPASRSTIASRTYRCASSLNVVRSESSPPA